MSEDGQLGFEAEQLSFGSAIELALFGSGVASIPLGDMASDGERCDDDRVRGSLGFAPGAMSNDAKDFSAEGDRLLPDFEIPQASCHGHTMAARGWGSPIKPLPTGANARSPRSRHSAACENSRL